MLLHYHTVVVVGLVLVLLVLLRTLTGWPLYFAKRDLVDISHRARVELPTKSFEPSAVNRHQHRTSGTEQFKSAYWQSAAALSDVGCDM